MMADCDLAEARLQQFDAAYRAAEGKGPALADAAAARQQAAGERTAPAATPTTPTAEEYAQAHAEQQRTIDRSTSQLAEDEQSEPGRDYEPH
jgi:hypothetical protein